MYLLQDQFFRFKDKLVTPLRTDILLISNLMGPSLESLPMELHMKIADILSSQELRCLSLCSRKLFEACSELLERRKAIANMRFDRID